jgi:SPP1 gp7 family putative phage head morphogenesis protein
MARIDHNLVAEAIGLPPEAAIAYFRAKGYAITWDWQEQARTAEEQAFTVAKAMRMDVLQDIKEMVQKALDDGIAFQDFRKNLEPKLQAKGWWGRKVVEGPGGSEIVQLGSPHRLETIYRTNLQSAFMAGRREEQEANAEERPFLQYIALADARTRPEHLAMNGKIYPINDPIWKKWTPPNGYNCRCRTRALTPEQAEKRGGVSPAPKVEPDPGFRTNPAGKAWAPDMRTYSPEIRAVGKELVKK